MMCGKHAGSMREGAGSTVLRRCLPQVRVREALREGCGKVREARFSAISLPHAYRSAGKAEGAREVIRPPFRGGYYPLPGSRGLLP
jgi:hypothetical protein